MHTHKQDPPTGSMTKRRDRNARITKVKATTTTSKSKSSSSKKKPLEPVATTVTVKSKPKKVASGDHRSKGDRVKHRSNNKMPTTHTQHRHHTPVPDAPHKTSTLRRWYWLQRILAAFRRQRLAAKQLLSKSSTTPPATKHNRQPPATARPHHRSAGSSTQDTNSEPDMYFDQDEVTSAVRQSHSTHKKHHATAKSTRHGAEPQRGATAAPQSLLSRDASMYSYLQGMDSAYERLVSPSSSPTKRTSTTHANIPQRPNLHQYSYQSDYLTTYDADDTVYNFRDAESGHYNDYNNNTADDYGQSMISVLTMDPALIMAARRRHGGDGDHSYYDDYYGDGYTVMEGMSMISLANTAYEEKSMPDVAKPYMYEM
jgi:hypothetical protein